MKARPILMNGDMVNAILDGRKSQTRRQLKRVEGESFYAGKGSDYTPIPLPTTDLMEHLHGDNVRRNCPYGQVGDLLWVRETFWEGVKMTPDGMRELDSNGECIDVLEYRATSPLAECFDDDGGIEYIKWKPSIFMPRWASRITLEITDVRVERVQDIGYESMKAEGVCQRIIAGAVQRFLKMSIGSRYGTQSTRTGMITRGCGFYILNRILLM